MRAGVGVCVPVGSKVLVGMGVDMGVDMGVAVGAHLGEEGWNGIEVKGGFGAWASVAVELVAGRESEEWVAGSAGQAEKLSWPLPPTSRPQQAQTPDATAHVNSLPCRQQTTVLLQYWLLGDSPQSGTSRHAVLVRDDVVFKSHKLTADIFRVLR